MRRVINFLALLLLVSATKVQTLHKAHLSELQEPSQVHPAIRAFTTGTSSVFAIPNSHIRDDDYSYTENITLLITNYDTGKKAQVTVSTPSAIFPTATFSVLPLETYQFVLPPEIQTDYRVQFKNSYRITDRSISLAADTKVTLVVRNSHSDQISEDMYVVYPVCSLGRTYQSVGDENPKQIPTMNILSIVALQDNTTITFDPPITNPSILSLKAGQVLTIAEDIFPMTNYQIESNFPVAVVSGAVCGFGYTDPYACNYEAVMLFSMQDDGYAFPYTPFDYEEKGELLIMAQYDDTEILIDGAYYETIPWYSYVYLSIPDGSAFITTSKPATVLATPYMRSDGQGSALLAHIPSVAQFTNQTWIQVSTGLTERSPANHYVRLQADAQALGRLAVDDVVVDRLLYQRQGISDFYMVDVPVQPGTHVIRTRSSQSTLRYSVTVYGYASFTAYAYTPGIDVPTTGNC